jgi:hypothetical protein
MKILVRDESGVRALEEGFATEAELQEFLREHPDLMPLEEIDLNAPGLLCIGWEVGLASGAEDILYIDRNGLLTVVETKLRKNPQARREVVGQVLEYAAQMATWSSADVALQAERFFADSACPEQYRGCTLEKALRLFVESGEGPPELSYDYFLGQVQANIDSGHFRLIIAIDDPPEPLLKTVEFVNRFSQRFEMYLIQLKRFRDLARDQNIFVPALFGKVAGRRPGLAWGWDRYIAELGWSTQDVEGVKKLMSRLESVSQDWQPRTRFNPGWLTVFCFGKYVFGAQAGKRRGIELWFRLMQRPEEAFPEGVHVRQTKNTLYLGGNLDRLDDSQLRRLCEASLKEVGLEP